MEPSESKHADEISSVQQSNLLKRPHGAIVSTTEDQQPESPPCKKTKSIEEDDSSVSGQTTYGSTKHQQRKKERTGFSQKERNVFRRQQKNQRKQEQFASMTEEEKQQHRAQKMERRKREQEKKEAHNQKTMEASANGMKICVDLSFDAIYEKDMEYTNVVKQLCYCWSANKRATHAASFHLLNANEKWMKYFAEQGVVGWKGINIHEDKDVLDVFGDVDKQRLIYLTPDSEHALSEQEFRDHKHDNVYILGGIVDRNVKKNLTLDRARKLGIRHCKLPLDQLPDIQGRQCFNINAVFNMLVRFQNAADEESWTDIMEQEVPNRNKRSAQTRKQRRKNDKNKEDKKVTNNDEL